MSESLVDHQHLCLGCNTEIDCDKTKDYCYSVSMDGKSKPEDCKFCIQEQKNHDYEYLIVEEKDCFKLYDNTFYSDNKRIRERFLDPSVPAFSFFDDETNKIIKDIRIEDEAVGLIIDQNYGKLRHTIPKENLRFMLAGFRSQKYRIGRIKNNQIVNYIYKGKI